MNRERCLMGTYLEDTAALTLELFAKTVANKKFGNVSTKFQFGGRDGAGGWIGFYLTRKLFNAHGL